MKSKGTFKCPSKQRWSDKAFKGAVEYLAHGQS